MNLERFGSNAKLSVKSYYKKTIDSTFSMNPHSHDYIEIMDVISGKVVLDIYEGKQIAKTVVVKPGTLIVIAANTFHKISCPDEVLINNIEFDTSLSLGQSYLHPIQYITSSPEWRSIFGSKYGIVTMVDCNDVANTIDRIIARIEKVGLATTDLHVDSSVFHLLVKVSECYKTSNLSDGSGTFYVSKAVSIIKANLGNEVPVSEIAERLGITVSYLERVFKQSTQMTVKKYSDLLKLDLIKTAITMTDEAIETIMKRYGYKNISQLNYQFKQVYNATPKEYRRQYLQRTISGTEETYKVSFIEEPK